MKYNYKRTFDAVHLAPDQQEHMRSVLSSRVSDIQKEDQKNMKLIKKPRKMLIASAAVLVLMLSAGFAYRNQIIQLLGGGTIKIESDSLGYQVSMNTEFESEPAEVKNGQIYFVLDGSNTNITSYCSESTYYQYEETDESGCRKVVIVGGTPDNLGWGEFVFDADGKLIGSNATYECDDTEAMDLDYYPLWLKNAQEELDPETNIYE